MAFRPGCIYHEPVLLNQAVEMLIGNRDKTSAKLYVDCTLGGGGYTKKILEDTASDIKVLAIDRDENSIKYCKKSGSGSLAGFSDRIIYVNDNFANIIDIITKAAGILPGLDEVKKVSGAVLDLGLSTYQLEHEDGFSYQRDTELDMRAGKDGELTAKDVLNTYSEKELIKIFKTYGELKYSRQISRDIVECRKKKKFERTTELPELLKKKIPGKYFNKDMSKIFQALRIEVNKELDNLKSVLENIVGLLETDARLVCVSYHSLEDRLVKNFFREVHELEILTKKPVVPSKEEIDRNPGSRSAKLRAAQRIGSVTRFRKSCLPGAGLPAAGQAGL